MFCDLEMCLSRNYHKRDRKQIEEIIRTWNPTPLHYIKLDIRSLLENRLGMQDAEDIALVSKLENSSISNTYLLSTINMIKRKY